MKIGLATLTITGLEAWCSSEFSNLIMACLASLRLSLRPYDKVTLFTTIKREGAVVNWQKITVIIEGFFSRKCDISEPVGNSIVDYSCNKFANIVFQESGPPSVHGFTGRWIDLLGSALHSRDSRGAFVIVEHSSTANREHNVEGTSR